MGSFNPGSTRVVIVELLLGQTVCNLPVTQLGKLDGAAEGLDAGFQTAVRCAMSFQLFAVPGKLLEALWSEDFDVSRVQDIALQC